MPPRRRRMFERLREMGLDMQAPRLEPLPVAERVRLAEAEAQAILDERRNLERRAMHARMVAEMEQQVLLRAMPRPMHVGRAEPMPDGMALWSGAHGNVRRRIVGRTGRNNRPNRKIMLQASKKESDV